MRRVHEAIVAVEKYYIFLYTYTFVCVRVRACVCLCVGMGARPRACVCARVAVLIQHVTLRHICHFRLCVFQPLFHKRHKFQKKVTEYKMFVFVFSTTLNQNISHSKMNSARYCHKCENVFMQSTRYSFRILMKLEFSRRIFRRKKIVNVKFLQNPSSGSRVVPTGQTDVKLIVVFRNFVNAPEKHLEKYT
jgi:hypothetical protein